MLADEARLQEVLRLRKENFDTHVAADAPDARQFVPGRSWAAWSRALGLLLPPLTVADLGCGDGYLTHRGVALGRAGDRRRSLDGRARSRPGARRPPPRLERRLEARRARGPADQGRHGRRRPAVAGAAPRRRTRCGRWPRRPHHRAGRPRAGARSARAPRRVGPDQARRSPPRLPRRRAEVHAGRSRPARTARRRRRPQGRRPLHGADRIGTETTDPDHDVATDPSRDARPSSRPRPEV